MPDSSLPSTMTPFQPLFGRSTRTTLDMLVPQMDDTEATGGLSNFIESRRHNMREVAEALKKLHEDKGVARQRHNAGISRPAARVNVAVGDLVLARESDSALFRQEMGSKLVHEKWTGPWTVTKVVFKGLSAVIEMEGRKKRSRTVSVASLKPFCRRSSDLRHPIADEFTQIVRGADLGLKGDSVAAAPIYTLRDRKEVESEVGTVRWEYRGRYLDGVSSDWVKETEALDCFTPLQLDTFHALWNLNPPSGEQTQPTARQKKRALSSRREALAQFQIGTKVTRSYAVGDRQVSRVGQVYDFFPPYWRSRFPENDWGELTVSDMKKSVLKQVRPVG